MCDANASTPERYLHDVDPRISFWDIARIYERPSAAVTALEAYLDAEPLAGERDAAAAHVGLATAYAMRGDLDSAEPHFSVAERRYALLDDELSIAYLQLRRHILQHQRDEQDAMLAALPRALRVAQAHTDAYLEAILINDLGLMQLQRGLAAEGIASLVDAIQRADYIGNHWLSSLARLNLGLAFHHVHDFEVAISWLTECLGFAASANSAFLRYQCVWLLAQCFLHLGNAERALAFSSETLVIAKGVEYPFSVAEGIYAVAIIRARLGRSKLAIETFEFAAKLYRQVDTPAAAARRWICAWFVEHETNVYTLLTYQALRSVAASNVVVEYSTVFDLHDALAESAIALGLKDDAIAHLQRSKALAIEYWEQVGNKQARAAVSQHQLSTAQSEAERERDYRKELANALAEAKSLNRVNQRLVAQLRSQSAVLKLQATEDALTGVGNRRYFDTSLASELKRAAAFSHPVSVALIDLDNFKDINDRFSHQMGDRVLIEFAAILRESTATTDFVARYGGEEFGIILPETDQAAAFARVEAIRSSVALHPWASIDGGLQVTASIGIATAVDNGTETELLSAADRMLHTAKENGKNQVRHQIIGSEIRNN